jgi:membrane protein implicated in regulation of membrane protease activity
LDERSTLGLVVSFLLSVTFACGLVIAVAHVLNKRFIAPVYDVAANLTAFGCAVAASLLLGHWIPALLSAGAIVCWLMLARRTFLARRRPASSRGVEGKQRGTSLTDEEGIEEGQPPLHR